MSYLEKQAAASQTFYDINQTAFQQIMNSQQESFRKFLELNNDFSKKLPEVKDLSSFVELQREYGETLWSGVTEATQLQAEILRTSAEETTSAVRKLFTVSTDD
jgi:hypothetical protein